jgi:hypothetical protein
LCGVAFFGYNIKNTFSIDSELFCRIAFLPKDSFIKTLSNIKAIELENFKKTLDKLADVSQPRVMLKNLVVNHI